MSSTALPVVIAYVNDAAQWALRSGMQRPPKGFCPAYVLQFHQDPLPVSPVVPELPAEVLQEAGELFRDLVVPVPQVGADGVLRLGFLPSAGVRSPEGWFPSDV